MSLIYNITKFKERRQELRQKQTEAEKALWKRLRNKGFFGVKFFRQFSVGAYVVDFYCPTYKLAIELDGGQHANEENKEYDDVRTEYLISMRIDVIRFWNNEVIQNMEGVLKEIEKKLNIKSTPPDLYPRGINPLTKGEEKRFPLFS